MRFVLQRVVHNDLGWASPSIGRLKSRLDRGYVHKHGFAHEDWNFAKDRVNGYVYGYAYFWPKDPRDRVSIAFATYESGGHWSLAGFFDNAQYVDEGVVFPKAIVTRRASELLTLEKVGSLGGAYKGSGKSKLESLLRQEAGAYHWRAKPNDVHALASPIGVPFGTLPKTASKYFSRPTNISAAVYAKLKSLAKGAIDARAVDDYADGGDLEFPEGKKVQRLHFARERNKTLVQKFKRGFKAKHGALFCEACGFDFSKTYGQLGIDFTEAHHKKPVHLLDEKSSTKVGDLASVCSNCHRMLHRTGSSMTIDALRRLIKTNAK